MATLTQSCRQTPPDRAGGGAACTQTAWVVEAHLGSKLGVQEPFASHMMRLDVQSNYAREGIGEGCPAAFRALTQTPKNPKT